MTKSKNPKTFYIGNLPPKITETELKSLISKYGQITKFRFAKNFFTSENKNFAFVELNSSKSTQKAINQLNNLYYKEHYLITQSTEPKKAFPPTP